MRRVSITHDAVNENKLNLQMTYFGWIMQAKYYGSMKV